MYSLTHNETYLSAVLRCADAVAANYLRPGELQINGGELDDVMVNDHCPPHTQQYQQQHQQQHQQWRKLSDGDSGEGDGGDMSSGGGLCVHGISGGTYGVMALAELALVTQNSSHVAMLKTVMDWMLAFQWTCDINLGYYNSKARFQGADFKTVGAAVNGMVRSEITYCLWLAWRATRDPLYLRSFEQTLAWVSYTQYDNLYNEYFYGVGVTKWSTSGFSTSTALDATSSAR
jgi:hypothetical protein